MELRVFDDPPDLGGDTVADGSYSMTFRMFNVSSGGVDFWNETQASVTVERGLFNVILGSVNTLNDVDVDNWDADVWLEIEVDGDTLSPRQQLLSTYIAQNARLLQGKQPGTGADNLLLLNGSGEVPAGVWTIEAQFQGATWTPVREGVTIDGTTSYAVRCGGYNCRIDAR